MKTIYPDKITNVAGSTENSNYLAANVQNNFQKKVWKATANTVELTITVAANSKAIAIFNTNANSIVIAIKTAAHAVIETYSKTLSGYTIRNFWQDYTEQILAHEISIVFTAPDNDVVEVGAVHVGGVESFFVDPDFGISEGLLDFSVIKIMNNDAVDVTPKRVLRTFDGRLLVDRDSNFYDITIDFLDIVGDTIKAFLITDLDNVYWTVLGWFRSVPSGSHEYINKSYIDFQIEEVP